MALSSELRRTREVVLRDLYDCFESLPTKRNASLNHDEDRMLVKEKNNGMFNLCFVSSRAMLTVKRLQLFNNAEVRDLIEQNFGISEILLWIGTPWIVQFRSISVSCIAKLCDVRYPSSSERGCHCQSEQHFITSEILLFCLRNFSYFLLQTLPVEQTFPTINMHTLFRNYRMISRQQKWMR